MKQFALALAVLLAASSPLIAKECVKKPKAPPAATTQVVKPAQRPVLDQFKTQSIAPASNEAAGTASAPRRERSGIEINPWVVPNFL
ncbi:hypothetical protein ACSBOB_04875 [Mesorhizobium sp. ASY16-5R]|uniref:hypothetical protein n=1 Tax=Mesorhizobium sp. ASY16-5R TaxID=3445772 RepID=UPI003F9EC533